MMFDFQTQQEPTICSKCGSDDDVLDDWRVTVRDGEEGYSEVVMMLCNACTQKAIELFHDFGFRNHHHGSTTYLDDQSCPGYGACDKNPFNEYYGPWLIIHPNDVPEPEEMVPATVMVAEPDVRGYIVVRDHLGIYSMVHQDLVQKEKDLL